MTHARCRNRSGCPIFSLRLVISPTYRGSTSTVHSGGQDFSTRSHPDGSPAFPLMIFTFSPGSYAHNAQAPSSGCNSRSVRLRIIPEFGSTSPCRIHTSFEIGLTRNIPSSTPTICNSSPMRQPNFLRSSPSCGTATIFPLFVMLSPFSPAMKTPLPHFRHRQESSNSMFSPLAFNDKAPFRKVRRYRRHSF